jgi:hypothetical protein
MAGALRAPSAPHPALRLRLAPHSAVPRPVDRARWPRSYDPPAEPPSPLAGLPLA